MATTGGAGGRESEARQLGTPLEPDARGELATPERVGRYQVRRLLASGSPGIVFEARDPALHRRVALKVLRADGGEIQAMARLAHPNIAAVYEIDRVGDEIRVAMELVAGSTLGDWLRARPRRPREVLDMFVAAGRGLAAAHAAGLVHRDVRADRILIGLDGRPRICDLGMPREGLAPSGPSGAQGGLRSGQSAWNSEARDARNGMTEDRCEGEPAFHGSEIGAAYLAAGLCDGEPTDARGDQLAFCVALWQALCGSDPLPGARPREIRTGVRVGPIAEAAGSRVPRWLVAMLRRGLAVDPDARWPDLAALLDALERRARAGRRWALASVAAGTAIAAAAAAAVLAAARVAPEPCAPPDLRLATVWNPLRGAAVYAHTLGVDPAHGAGRYALIAAALDAGARGWRDMHVAACRQTRVEHSQSDAMLDRRMECLDRWLVELGDTVDVIGQAGSPSAVDQALRAASSLSPLEACADAHALAAAPPPASVEDRAIAIELANRTRELDVAQRAGRLDGLLIKAVDLESAARSLGHRPTLAAVLAMEVRVLNRLNTRGATEEILRELVQVAARIHDDRNEAMAWMDLMVAISHAKGKRDEALALVPSARAAVLRAGDPLDLRSDLLYHHAIVLDYGSRPAEGLALLQEARTMLEHAGAASPLSPLARRLADVWYEIGTSYLKAEDLERAIAALHEAIARSRIVNGVDSIDEAYSWQVLSVALQRAGKTDEALAAIHDAVRVREVRLGPSVALAAALTVEAGALDGAGRWAEAVRVYDRAIQMARATMAPGDVNLGLSLTNRGVALTHMHRFDEAARDLDEAIALFDRAGARTTNVSIAIASRGDLWVARDRCDDARRDYERALAMAEELAGPTFHVVIYPLAGMGACLVRNGHPAEAIPLLERALRCNANGADAYVLALVRAYLGRARVDTGRDVAGGLAMARAARTEMAAAPEAADEIARLDRWLAGR